ncbi:hypothetical protein RSAG8_05203, partial [Rhizoctonia solani AG-8 WAC10335]
MILCTLARDLVSIRFERLILDPRNGLAEASSSLHSIRYSSSVSYAFSELISPR